MNHIYKNKLLLTFLENQQNLENLKDYLNFPTTTKKQKLESNFHIHAKKVYIISYFLKTLTYESQRFDTKIRKREKLLGLTDDERILEFNAYNQKIDFMEENYLYLLNLEDSIESVELHRLIKSLPQNQKMVLKLLYELNYSEIEVSQYLSITQQAVNKTKNKALNRLRENYKKTV